MAPGLELCLWKTKSLAERIGVEPLGMGPDIMKTTLESIVSNVPFAASTVNKCSSLLTFRGSRNYWEDRYSSGRNSGAGSYGQLAEFKAEFINAFVKEHGVQSVIEFGSGDGNQLELAEYPRYLGLDVSRTAIEGCQQRFADDDTKGFYLYDSTVFTDTQCLFRAQLALSLDVIYHLVEERVFTSYLENLFDAAERFVIVYSSNHDETPASPHVRHRHFSQWVAEHRPDWELIDHVANRYPYDPRRPQETSFADFYVFRRGA